MQTIGVIFLQPDINYFLLITLRNKKTNSVSTKNLTTALTDLFTKHFGEKPEDIVLLPASGSDRKYMRLSNEKHSVIGAFNPDKKENNTFFYFSQVFAKHKLPVPEIVAKSGDKQYYLLQDLGDTSLFDVL